MVREEWIPLLLVLFNTNRMADVNLIKDLAATLIMTLDKHSSPNDIIEGFDEALEEYETLLQHINKNVQRH
jgi:hypothetical protein